MKKKKLLGKIVSLVLAAALTVTALPTSGMEVQAAEQVQTETEEPETAEAADDAETTEDASSEESSQADADEKSDEAQSTEEDKASEEEKSSEVESETEEKSSEAEEEKTNSESEEESQEQSEEEDLREVVGNMDVNLHVYNGADGGLGYDEVYLQYWQAGTAEITNATEEYFEKWECNRYKLTAEGDDWYGITLKGSMEGFNLLDSDGSDQINGFESNMVEFQGDLWYRNEALYTDKACTTRLTPIPTDMTFLLVGEFPGTAWDATATPNFVKEGETGKYSITIKSVPAKTYSYKILQNPEIYGWKKPWATDDNNLTYTLDATADLTITIDSNDDAKSVDIKKVYVKDIVVEIPESVQKGKETALSGTGIYYKGDGTKTENAAVAYKVTAEGASITEDGKLKVDAAYAGDTVTITAVCEGFEKEFTINVVDVVYKYTIYYYNPEYNKDTLDLWLWNKEGAGATEGTPFTGEEVLEDGNTWIKAELELSYTSLGIIPRSKGSWDYYKDNERYYVNETAAEESTLYIVVDDQKIYTTLPEIKTAEKRYLIVEYKRNDGSAQDWYFYTWNNGKTGFYPFEKTGDKWIAQIPVKAGLSSVSYCIERAPVGEDGNPVHWTEKDGNDYTCSVPEDQTVVKIVMEEGQGITKTYPYNIGYELAPKDKKIHFYYRNNDAFLEGKTNKYASVAVEINGTEYPMEFDEQNQRYAYDLENLEPGTFKYRYVLKETADGEKTYDLDRYNENKVTENEVEYSVVEYGTFKAVVSASVYRDSMDYNDNNVLTVKIDAEQETDIKGMEVAEAYADLTALGGSSKVEIVPELLELTIAVKQGIESGEKKIPVTVYDQFKNEYTTEATVTVTDRNKGADFDWDEAIIYFAVTDRFFDGNTSNNGAGYDKSENGSSSYHGGDFAGLTEKLDYLKELGVNTIWITPIVANDMEDGLQTDVDGIKSWGYHGYWASDFDKLDSHLGTEEEFATLLNEAHARGMKLMVDVVLNHSGYQQEEKFNNILKDENGNSIPMIRDDSQMVTGSDQKASLSGLPDFLTENAEVRELLVEWQSNWISKYDIDYYRVDTVKHVDDTTWSAFKNALTKINPEFKMIGEWAGAGYATDTGMLRTGRMDSLLDFDFNGVATDFATGSIAKTEDFLNKRNVSIDNTATLGQFLSSHDEDGFVYNLYSTENEGKGLPKERAEALGKVAASLQITAKGQPVIYYGEEIGLTGANNYPYQTNRYDFDWTKANNGCDMLDHYKKLLAVRNRYSEVLAKGTRETVVADDANGIDVFKRTYGDTTLTIALNISDSQKTHTFEGLTKGTIYKDCYSGKRYAVDEDGKLTITIPAAADGGTAVLIEGGEFEEKFYVADIADQTYTGSAIKLSADQLKVYYGLKELKAGTDYTVKYSGNTKNVGTVTVKITGKGNYVTEKPQETTFKIVPKSVADSKVELDYQAVLVKTGKEQKPLAKITYNGKKLGSKDYTVEYYKLAADGATREGNKLTGVKEAGNYEMVITGKGNFTGVASEIITVKETGNLMSKAKVTLKTTTYVCDGTEHKPEVTVKFSGKEIAAENYTVEYQDNVNAGTAKVIITGIADKGYYGSVTKTFKITGQKLSSVAKIDETNWKANVDIDVHTGKAVQTSVGLVLKSDGKTPLVFDTDYTVSYQKNTKPGTATMVFTGKGKYTGVVKKTFKVNKIALSNAEGSKFVFTVDPTAPYGKKGAKAAVSVSYDGVALVEGKDYKLTFKNNKKAGDKATVTITGIGSFTQKVDMPFTVEKAIFDAVYMTVNNVVFVNKKGNFISTPVITDRSGAKLTNKKDYTLKYYLVNADGTEKELTTDDIVELPKTTVDGKEVVSPAQMKVVATAVDTTNYKTELNTRVKYYKIVQATVSNASVTAKAKVYTGKAITLDEFDMTVAVGKGNSKTELKLGKDYEIVEGTYVNNINKGTASVTIKGIGNYTGTKKITFKITSRTMAWWWNLGK